MGFPLCHGNIASVPEPGIKGLRQRWRSQVKAYALISAGRKTAPEELFSYFRTNAPLQVHRIPLL